MSSSPKEYPTEYFTTAREELMFRVKQRDSFLIMHLLVQGVLLALAYGVKLGGAEAVAPMPQALHLAIPLAVVFSLLYYTEDRLIGQISSYLAALSSSCKSNEIVVNINANQKSLSCWDGSPQLREYAKTTIMYRLLCHVIAFIVTPCVLFVLHYRSNMPTSCDGYIWFFLQLLLLILIFVISIVEYTYRSEKTGQNPTETKHTKMTNTE